MADPIPGAAIYGEQQNQANLAYQNALNNIRTQRLQSFQRYGFLGDVDPTTGAVSNMRVDPNNPTGQYQQMLQGQSREMHHAQDVARAGLGGGYAARQISDLRNQEALQGANLGQSMQGEMSALDQALAQASYDRGQGMIDAEQLAAQNALANQDFTPPPATEAAQNQAASTRHVVHTVRRALAKRVARGRTVKHVARRRR